MSVVLKSLEESLWDHIECALKDQGYHLVRVKVSSSKEAVTHIQIMVEKKEHGKAISLEECAQIHTMLLVLLQVESPIQKDYHLEVSSCGIERPLVKYEDFTQERFLGKKISVALYHPLAGNGKEKKITGFLVKAENHHIYIMHKIGKVEKIEEIDFYNIAEAHIVFVIPKKK